VTTFLGRMGLMHGFPAAALETIISNIKNFRGSHIINGIAIYRQIIQKMFNLFVS